MSMFYFYCSAQHGQKVDETFRYIRFLFIVYIAYMYLNTNTKIQCLDNAYTDFSLTHNFI